MELHAIYPSDIPRECREYAATLEIQPSPRLNLDRRTALAVADLFEMLESLTGPTKWVRLNHNQRLSFFAFDPQSAPRQHPQVIVQVGPPHHAGLTTVEYLLPAEQRPWMWATARASTTAEAAKLVLEGLILCESRREYLVQEG